MCCGRGGPSYRAPKPAANAESPGGELTTRPPGDLSVRRRRRRARRGIIKSESIPEPTPVKEGV